MSKFPLKIMFKKIGEGVGWGGGVSWPPSSNVKSSCIAGIKEENKLMLSQSSH